MSAQFSVTMHSIVYVGGWIYPEYSVAGLIPVVGFDSWQYSIVQYSTGQYSAVQHSTEHCIAVQYSILEKHQIDWIDYFLPYMQYSHKELKKKPGLAKTVTQTALKLY